MIDQYQSPEGRRLLSLVDGSSDPSSPSTIKSYPVSGLNEASYRRIAKAIAPVEAMIVHRPSWSALHLGESGLRLSMQIEDVE